MHFQVAHGTTKTEAKQRVKDALERARPQMEGQVTLKKEEWSGDTLLFEADLKGKTITGTLAVTDTDLVIDAKLPLMWRMFEGVIEREIEKQVRTLRG